MKKILFPVLAVAALAAAPAAYAKSMEHYDAGSWHVLSDANTLTCFVSNHRPTIGETTVSGPYATEAQALSAKGADVACGGQFTSH